MTCNDEMNDRIRVLSKITTYMLLILVMDVVTLSLQIWSLSKMIVTPQEVKAEVLINRGIALETVQKLDRISEETHATNHK